MKYFRIKSKKRWRVSTLGKRDRIWNIRNINGVGGGGGVKLEILIESLPGIKKIKWIEYGIYEI